MKEEIKILGHNIKFLRNKAGLSQEALAEKLGIKRSNVAVYESKNVEPRLRVILQIAQYFDIDIRTLIQTRLTEEMTYPQFGELESDEGKQVVGTLRLQDGSAIKEYIAKTIQMKKVIEGQKAFYDFQRETLSESMNPTKKKLLLDIDNFLQLMDHMSVINKNFLEAFNESSEHRKK